MTCGLRGLGRYRARCRRSTAGSRAPGSAQGAAAQRATPLGPRSWPESPAVVRAGRQRQSPTSWCRTSKGGSAVAACSRPGRSMRLRLPGNAARYQLCAMVEPLGRQVKWASVRSLAESVPTGTSAARRRRPKRSLQCKRWPLRELLSCSSGGRRPWRLRPCQLQLHQQEPLQALGGVQHQWLPVRFSRRRARRRGGHSSR
jgi:hypothetical protein